MPTPRAGSDGGRPPLAEPSVLKQALDALSRVFYIVTPDGRLYWWNDQVRAVTGYTDEELADMHVRNLVPAEDHDVLSAAVADALGDGTTTLETTLTTADGDGHPYELTGTRLVTGAGDLVGLVGTGTEISDRRERERQLARARTHLEAAIEAGAVSTWHWSLADDRVVIGPAIAEALEIDPETARTGVSYDRVHARIHDTDEPRVAAAVEEAIESCGRFEVKYRVRTVDGLRWVINSGAVECQEGEPARVLGALTDITTQQRQQRRLERQRDDLELLNQVLRHDIRNELQIVAGVAEDLVAREGSERPAVERLRLIADCADRAVSLTETARDMAEAMLSAGTDPEAVALGPAVEQEVADARDAYPAATIDVSVSMPAVRVCADDLLPAIVRNLLTNAIRHNDTEDPSVVVDVTCDDERVRLSVADDGPGIPDDRKEAIFGRGDKGLESPGTGLGLYLVQTLVDNYGGRVWVEDNDPRGAVFVVELERA